MNSNGSLLASEFGKNVYWLYDCAAEFMEELDEIVTYEYTDETYHTKTTEGGSYCCFCYGTHHTTNSTLERHNIKKNILPQISNGRFAIVEKCEDCSYEKISYVAAKSVVADYYGTVDGEPHTLTVSDLSESGVTTQIRYGNSAETCTMTSAPNYTEEGQYTVYYSITYSYGGESMTEDGVAYVWLHDESSCGCGCGNENCDCKDKDCDGNCCNTSCGDNHNFVLLETIDPTCNTLGYSRYACVDCGKVEKRDYTNALDHNWQSKECVNCGEVMETESIEKLYMVATTDTHGEAVVGEYLVIVTDTDTKNPIANATISLSTDNKISVRLPDSRIIDNADQTTVTVLMNEDKAPVEGMQVSVDDKNGNYCSEKTDQNGQITIPDGSSITNSDGKATVGWTDADGNDWTITVKVEDFETKRPIENAEVNVGKTGNITIVLPDGEDMDKNNRITVIVTDQKKNPLEDQSVIVKNDLGNTESGSTDEDGKLTVPAVVVTEEHGAYIYGYPDGTFGAERSMSRSEAAAIFARLLAEKKGDVISENGNFTTKFSDVPANAWYAGYVKYLSNYGIVLGYEDGTFRPENAISRAEFTAMAVRFFEDYGDGNPEIVEMYADFTDVSSGYWAAEYIYNASVYGWIYGYGDGTFHADADITRVEVVALVNRMLGREADKEYISENLRFLNTFSDMPEAHWAYYAVMEAANAHTAVYNTEETWSK